MEVLTKISILAPLLVSIVLIIIFFVLNRLYWLQDWIKGVFGLAIGLGLLLTLGIGISQFIPSLNSRSLETNALSQPPGGDKENNASYDLGQNQKEENSAPQETAETIQSESMERGEEMQAPMENSSAKQVAYSEPEEAKIPTRSTELEEAESEESEFVAKNAINIKESEEKTIKGTETSVKEEETMSSGTSSDHTALIHTAKEIKEKIKDARTYGVMPLLEGYLEMASRLKGEKKSSSHYDKLGIEMETLKLLLNSRIGFIARDIKKFEEGKIDPGAFEKRIAVYDKDARQLLSTYELDN